MDIKEMYKDFREKKRELYAYSVLLKEAEGGDPYNYKVTLDCYCNCVDECMRMFTKISTVDWDGLPKRKVKYLKQLGYEFLRARERDDVLRKFKFIV